MSHFRCWVSLVPVCECVYGFFCYQDCNVIRTNQTRTFEPSVSAVYFVWCACVSWSVSCPITADSFGTMQLRKCENAFCLNAPFLLVVACACVSEKCVHLDRNTVFYSFHLFIEASLCFKASFCASFVGFCAREPTTSWLLKYQSLCLKQRLVEYGQCFICE